MRTIPIWESTHGGGNQNSKQEKENPLELGGGSLPTILPKKENLPPKTKIPKKSVAE